MEEKHFAHSKSHEHKIKCEIRLRIYELDPTIKKEERKEKKKEAAKSLQQQRVR